MTHALEAHLLMARFDKDVLSVVKKHGGFLAGGAITSVFASAPINDYDVFFPTVTAAEECIKEWKKEKKSKDTPIVTDTAHSFVHEGMRYQFIKVATGTPESVIAGFDWTVCMGAFTLDGKFVLAPEFLQHLAQRRLVFNIKTEYPVCALYRVRKYIKRGFELSGIETIKLALRIQDLDITNLKELRKQLMGIDTLFLRELTDVLKSEGERKYDLNEFLEMLDGHLEKLDRFTGEE